MNARLPALERALLGLSALVVGALLFTWLAWHRSAAIDDARMACTGCSQSEMRAALERSQWWDDVGGYGFLSVALPGTVLLVPLAVWTRWKAKTTLTTTVLVLALVVGATVAVCVWLAGAAPSGGMIGAR